MIKLDFYQKEGYYAEDIQKIASKKIWEKVTVRGLHLSRKTIQQAYKDIENLDFHGDIIDYLCFVCLSRLLASYGFAFQTTNSIKSALDTLKIFYEWKDYSQKACCRLVLKDESYIHYTFIKLYESEPDPRLVDEAKKFFQKKINKLMKIQLGNTKESAKLNRD